MNDYIPKLLASAFILSNCVPLPNKMFNLVMQVRITEQQLQCNYYIMDQNYINLHPEYV